MKNLKKLVEIARTCKGEYDCIYDDEFIAEFFNRYVNFIIDNEKIKRCDIGMWLCTDSWVGTRIYFFEDRPLAYSYQRGRKCKEDFYFFSKEIYNETKIYLESLLEEEVTRISTIADIEKEINCDYYSRPYREELLVKKGFVKNLMGDLVPVDIIDNKTKSNYIFDTLKVKYENGHAEIIITEDLLIPFQPFN